MSTEWFYTKDGEQLGPVSSKQLSQLAASGELQPTDLVWKEGAPDWKPASIVKGLFAETTTPPPPVPADSAATTPASPALGEAARGLSSSVTAQAKEFGDKATTAPRDLGVSSDEVKALREKKDQLSTSIRQTVLDPKAKLPEEGSAQQLRSEHVQLTEQAETAQQQAERLTEAKLQVEPLAQECQGLEKELAAARESLSEFY
jgi:hypothetical protein